MISLSNTFLSYIVIMVTSQKIVHFTYGCPFEENVEEAKEIEERYFANTANGENKVYGNVIDDDE